MDKPSSTDTTTSTEYISADQVVQVVIEAFIDARDVSVTERGKPRRFWPENGQVVAYVAGLPADCEPIKEAIREHMAITGDDGYLKFPVETVEINRATGCIRVVGDKARASQMRPLPKH